MIEVTNITKTYGKRHTEFTALDNISFSVPEGVSVAIVGKSGSGKSTLMHVMSGLDRPDSGEIRYDDQNILQFKQKKMDQFRARRMSFIFQSFYIQGNETCYDNVSLPLETAEVPVGTRRTKIEAALKSVELHDKIKEKAKNLSGGQKQRLAIARAIVNEPAVLFADEPTGNLDSVTGEVIERLLLDYSKARGATLIVVTHDNDLARKCDMQIYMKDGRVERIVKAEEK